MDRRDRKLKRIINLINVNGHTRAKIRGTLIFVLIVNQQVEFIILHGVQLSANLVDVKYRKKSF